MNILVIPTTDWLCHPSPHRHHYLARELAKRHKVYVLYFNMYKSSTKVNRYGEILIPAGGESTADLASYYIKNRKAHKATIEKAIIEHDIDAVLGANLLPSLSGFEVVRKLRKSGRKVVGFYDISDYFPESASIYYPDKPIKRRIIHMGSTYLFNRNLELADGLTSVSQPLMDIAGKKQPGKPSYLVTNGVEIKRFKEDHDPGALKAELGIQGRVIGMMGSLEKWLHVEPTIEGFAMLAKDFPDLTYLLVGDSIKTKYADELKALASDLGIADRMRFTGFVPYEQVPLYIKAMDIAICPFRTGLMMSDIALPNKVFEYLACGKRIVCTPLPEVKREAGQFIEFYDGADEFVTKVEGLLGSEQNDAGKRIEWASNHSWEKKSIELERLFKKRLGEV